VEAQRKALRQFIDQGLDVKERQMKGALGHLEKMEDVFFDAVSKATQGSGSALQGPWKQVLDAMKVKGTGTGVQAGAALEQLMAQAKSALRQGRATSLSASQAMMDSYAALVSGVLIGMSEGMQPAPAAGGGKTRKK
jgi:hypothetical protein